MFSLLTQDFKDTKTELISEAKLYGENEETTIIEFVQHIYKFGRDFNAALKTMVLQERIRKQKHKRLQNFKGVKSVQIDLKVAQVPIKSTFKTLAQLNTDKEEVSKRSRLQSFTKKMQPNAESKSFKMPKQKSKNRILRFSKREFDNDSDAGFNDAAR